MSDSKTEPATGAAACPFCSNDKLDLETDESGELGKGAYVRCPECTAMGPSVYQEDLEDNEEAMPKCKACGQLIRPDEDAYKKLAIEKWNKRTSEAK